MIGHDPQHEVEQIRDLFLKPIGSCTQSQQLGIREIRNQPGIRAAMYTDHEIDLNEHLEWIKMVSMNPKFLVFATLNKLQVPIGLWQFTELDALHKKSNFGWFFDEVERGGLGTAIEYRMIEYAFNSLKLEKLNCEVLESMTYVVNLHEKFGFVKEGFKRQNIEKNGERVGVVMLGLTKSDWLSNKQEIFEKNRLRVEKFSITIDTSIS